MINLMFDHRFIPKIVDGTKQHTVRNKRARTPKVGDPLTLRVWSARPYRSPTNVILNTTVRFVVEIGINLETKQILCCPNAIYSEEVLSESLSEIFAVNDGFDDFSEMMDWFKRTHKTPLFEGILIAWTFPRVEEHTYGPQ